MKTFLTISALALAASPLSAVITLNVPFQYTTGNITTGSTVKADDFTPLYQSHGLGGRPLEDLSGSSFEADTWYTAFTFSPTVTSDGNPLNNYTFAAQFGVGTDGFIALYLNSYNPANPIANALIANNDSGVNPAQSTFSFPLTAGLTYVLVQTLNNGDVIGNSTAFAKTVSMNVGGPGDINTPGFPPENPVPFGVDSTLGLAVLGAVGALRLRRSRKA